MFFKSNKEIKTKDLKLVDFDKIWTKFCFLDETGTLSDQKDQYFPVGILKMSQPYYLQSKLFFETRSISFYSYSISTKSDYYLKRFDQNPWLAYEQITLKLLDAALSQQEIVILLADYVTTPKDIRFEVEVKKKFNQYKERLALAGVCRFDSKSNDLDRKSTRL